MKVRARKIGRTLLSGKCQKGYRKGSLGKRKGVCILSGSLGKSGRSSKRRKSTMGRRRRK